MAPVFFSTKLTLILIVSVVIYIFNKLQILSGQRLLKWNQDIINHGGLCFLVVWEHYTRVDCRPADSQWVCGHNRRSRLSSKLPHRLEVPPTRFTHTARSVCVKFTLVSVYITRSKSVPCLIYASHRYYLPSSHPSSVFL